MKWAVSEDELNIARQRQEIIKIGLDIYNYVGLSKGTYVGRISGGVINGSANINADSDVRRTFTLNLVPDKESRTIISEKGYIWIDKMVDVSLGLVKTCDDEIYWKKFGRFIFTSTNTSYDATNNQLTLNCSDLMSTLDGSVNGELGQLSIVFPAYKEYRSDDPTIHYWHSAVGKNLNPRIDPVGGRNGTGTYRYRTVYYLSSTADVPATEVTSYANQDFYVFGADLTNSYEAYIQIGNLPQIPIVDRETRQPINKRVIQKGGVYSVYIDDGCAVLAINYSITNITEFDSYTYSDPMAYNYYDNKRAIKLTAIRPVNPNYNDLYDFCYSGEPFDLSAFPNYYLFGIDGSPGTDNTTPLELIIGNTPAIPVYAVYYANPNTIYYQIKEKNLQSGNSYIGFMSQYTLIDGVNNPKVFLIPVCQQITIEKPHVNQKLSIDFNGNVHFSTYNKGDKASWTVAKRDFKAVFDAKVGLFSENSYVMNTGSTFFGGLSTPSNNNLVYVKVAATNQAEGTQIDLNVDNKYTIFLNEETPVTAGYFQPNVQYVLQFIEGKGFMVFTSPPHPNDVTEGTPLCYYVIRDAVKTVLNQLTPIPESQYFIDDIGEYNAMPGYNVEWEKYRQENPLWNNIPYDLEFSHGDSVLPILQKFRDLYPNYEIYFDEEGCFRMNITPSGDEDPVIINNDFFQSVLVSDSVSVDLTPVRNISHVWGKVIETDYYSDQVTYGNTSDDNGILLPTYTHWENVTLLYACMSTITGNGSSHLGMIVKKNPIVLLNNSFNLPLSMKDNLPVGTQVVLYIPSDTGTTNKDKFIAMRNPLYKKHNWGQDYDSRESIKIDPVGPIDPGNIDPAVSNINEYYPLVSDNPTNGVYIYENCRIQVRDLTPDKRYKFEVVKIYWNADSIWSPDEELHPVDPNQVACYGLKLVEQYNVPIQDNTNTYSATIEGYEDTYMNGDIIALKVPVANGENPKININHFGLVPIYDDVRNTYIDPNTLKANETYGFKIRKQRAKVGDSNTYTDITVALLLGQWQVQAIKVLVSDLNGIAETYTCQDGKVVRKYTKEYFQDVYACPEVEMAVLPNSPFTCQKIGERMSVYIDETTLTTCNLAVTRADYELYKLARLPDSISIVTKLCLFADVNMKVSYRHPEWSATNSYIVKSVSHDLSGGTTTWELMRFYPLYGSLGLTHNEIHGIDNATGRPSDDLYPYTHNELSAYTHERIRGV